ncbi:GIY-YIG nuclease family protein [Sphingomonas sp.]|uniref:GIY-YIG nuclease family protein n=1 Tax=Sphingomonas sp. TaxID=28214 RepID=UPI0035C7F4D4
MDERGGWVYIMADRYRGTMYVGVTADLAARFAQHRAGAGSDFCARYGVRRLVWAERGARMLDCIAHEKRWARAWRFDLIERGNPAWEDLYERIG